MLAKIVDKQFFPSVVIFMKKIHTSILSCRTMSSSLSEDEMHAGAMCCPIDSSDTGHSAAVCKNIFDVHTPVHRYKLLLTFS
jgi:hypothetical protein